MFGEIRMDFKNHQNDETATAQQIEERNAVNAQLLRCNKARVKQRARAEAERSEQLRQIATTMPIPRDSGTSAKLP